MLLRRLSPVPLFGALLASCAGVGNPIPDQPVIEELGSGMEFLEGPVWVPSEGCLIFSDIPAGKLMRWREGEGVTEWIGAANPNGGEIDGDGYLVTCQQGDRRLVRRSVKTGEIVDTVTTKSADGRYSSPNDLAIASDGTIWFTDPPWGLEEQRVGREQPANSVFRWDPESGESQAVFSDFCMPNGIALSPDEKTLYVSDTGGHPSHPDSAKHDLPPTVTAFNLEVWPPTVRWTIETISDGMCVDSLGRIYLTGPPGLTVHDPNGKQVGVLEMPGWTTNVELGGEDGSTLFLTGEWSLYRVRVNASAIRP